VKNKAAARCKF